MKNRYLERYERVVMVSIVGSNINNYLRRIIKRKVYIIKLIPISYREVHLVIKYSEYKKLIGYKSVYKINIIREMGNLEIRRRFKDNCILLSFVILGIVLIIFLSRFIFSVDVIHQDRDIRELVLKELGKYDIKRYSFKKSYDELEKIEDKILSNNKDRLEWIEIISYGTKYIVRVEERIINNDTKNDGYQDVVSKKNAVIVRIDAYSGEKIRSIGEYVKANDVVISGSVMLPDNTIVRVPAVGRVYGEVWYQVDMKYPYVYQESNFTGRSKTLYVINFFGKDVNLFNFNKYKTFHSKDKVLFCVNMIDVCIVKEKQYELRSLDEVYTIDMVRYKALEYLEDKLLGDNSDIKEVRDIIVLSSNSFEDGVGFRFFVKTIEEIGEILK